MDEYIDIVTPEGKPTGRTALKSEAHKYGWYHNTIHVWLYTSIGEILLQQRSHKKKIYPLLWDVSAAGHIDAGETFIEAAIRETKEEIGLQIAAKELIKIGTFLHETSYQTIQDNEFHQVYISELKTELYQLKPQEDEVEALKLVTFNEYEALLKESSLNHHFIPTNTAYYSFVLNAIKEKLSI
ncbi:NUDIX domain-containing protein [uncultured Winogradskyella sp.]|uniref:NUDIX hydrolase n=1 Tax=uncultured Winogradskyella sp. TaxID=395353 RepID=UPI002628FCD4|nr:NUDIX domain-containing protein [uncultured Winogradskyella sp.]